MTTEKTNPLYLEDIHGPLTVSAGHDKAVALAEKPGVAGPSGDYLGDFNEDQWWFRELLAVVANGTDDQKRAVAVVRNLLATVAANTAMLADYRQQIIEELAQRSGVMSVVVFAEFRLDHDCGHVDLVPFEQELEVYDGMKLVPEFQHREAIASLEARKQQLAEKAATNFAAAVDAMGRLEQSEALVLELEKDVAALRRLLGESWCGPRGIYPYTDDGQFFDGSENPTIDFMADRPEEIKTKMVTRVLPKRAAMNKESGK